MNMQSGEIPPSGLGPKQTLAKGQKESNEIQNNAEAVGSNDKQQNEPSENIGERLAQIREKFPRSMIRKEFPRSIIERESFADSSIEKYLSRNTPIGSKKYEDSAVKLACADDFPDNFLLSKSWEGKRYVISKYAPHGTYSFEELYYVHGIVRSKVLSPKDFNILIDEAKNYLPEKQKNDPRVQELLNDTLPKEFKKFMVANQDPRFRNIDWDRSSGRDLES